MAEPKLKFPPTIIRKLAELKLDPENAREHPPEQVMQIRASIKEHGPLKPIYLNPEGVIKIGNGTATAAMLEGYEEWPTITLDLTPEKWTAFAIADNKLPLGARWDEKRLAASLNDIATASGGSITALTGFTAKDLGRMGVKGFERVGANTAPQLSTNLAHRIVVDCGPLRIASGGAQQDAIASSKTKETTMTSSIRTVNDHRILVPHCMNVVDDGMFESLRYRGVTISTFETGKIDRGLYVGPFFVAAPDGAFDGDAERLSDAVTLIDRMIRCGWVPADLKNAQMAILLTRSMEENNETLA